MAHSKKEVEVPPFLQEFQKKGLGQWLNDAFGELVVEHEHDIHEIVDAIIAQRKQSQGKGKQQRKAMKSSSSGGPSFLNRDPKLTPPASQIRHSACSFPVSRSRIEPLAERVNVATTLGDLFNKAAKECREAVQNIIKECQKTRKPFFDEGFYFNRKTLYPPGSPADCTVTEPECAARLSEMYPRAPLFSQNVSFDDLVQGSVGDCFLIGAVSALASTNPKALQKLFVCHDTQCCVYGVMFFKNGAWEWVIVDDYVAAYRERSGPVVPLYATCGSDSELWPMILEKAYAKMHFNWDIIDGGWAKEALVDLTGGLPRSLDLHRADNGTTWQEFQSEIEDNFTILGCAVGDHVEAEGGAGQAGEEGAVFGLFHGHQYSVITSATTKKDGTGFVRVRNPWGGDAEWTGPFGDNTEEWEDEKNRHIREELNPEFKDDGAFWMRWSDFSKYMTSVDIVRSFKNDWKVLTIFGMGEKRQIASNTFILHVFDATTELAINMGQDDPKMMHPDDHEKQYEPYKTIKLTIFKLREVPKKFDDIKKVLGERVCNVRVQERSLYIREQFEPGLYCMMPCMTPSNGKTGVYIRVIGPPDSDYALFRYSDGEKTRLSVGNVPNLVPGASVEKVTTKAGVAQKVQKPGDDQTAQELRETKAYVEELKLLIQKQDKQMEQLRRSGSASMASSPSRGARLQGKQRLGMDDDRFDEVVQEVFVEVSGGRRTLDKDSALNALRLVVTLGAGMDECFQDLHQQKFGGVDLTLSQFRSLAAELVKSWPVLA